MPALMILAGIGTGGCASREVAKEVQISRDASRSIRHVDIEWEKVASFTFDDPAELSRFRIAEGDWEIRDGLLRAVGGKQNRAIMLAEGGQDPVRIEFDATNHASKEGLIGDITILLNSVPEKSFFNAGYALTTGSYWNNCTTFYRHGKALANTAWSPVRSGKRNHVVFIFNRGHIRYEMNGDILLETWDTAPVELIAERWIGLRTWATLMEIDNLTIFRGLVR